MVTAHQNLHCQPTRKKQRKTSSLPTRNQKAALLPEEITVGYIVQQFSRSEVNTNLAWDQKEIKEFNPTSKTINPKTRDSLAQHLTATADQTAIQEHHHNGQTINTTKITHLGSSKTETHANRTFSFYEHEAVLRRHRKTVPGDDGFT